MINKNELRGIIAREGQTQKSVANELGISRETFNRKMKKGVFDSDEIYIMIDFLNITDPVAVFFADEVTQ
jgi:DNA-binding XRE family transcriptional regulator